MPSSGSAVTTTGDGPLLVTLIAADAVLPERVVTVAVSGVVAPGCSGTPFAQKEVPCTIAITPFTVTPEPSAARTCPCTRTLSAVSVAPLDGLAMMIDGKVLVTVSVRVACAPCGVIPDTVSVFAPKASAASAEKVFPTTAAGTPFTVMLALVAPEKVPVTAM